MRIVQYVVTIVIILGLNFFLPRLMPGDPLSAIFDSEQADGGVLLTSEARAELLSHYGLDKPMRQQFASYVEQLLHGDLGWSIRYQRPVSDLLMARVGWTIGLVATATLFAAMLGTLLGLLSAHHQGGWLDALAVSGVMCVGSWPSFVIGVLLILLFSITLGWLPIGGAQTPGRIFSDAGAMLVDILKHAVLPWASLALVSLPGFFGVARTSALGALRGAYVQVARSKGLSGWAVTWRHVFPNTVLPVLTALTMRLGFALTGAMTVEVVFQYPGMGTLIFEAARARDYALLQGTFLLIMLTVVSCNLLAELLYRRLDPRLGGR